jgi:enamine deaminase RidA (YjgF/YER057c/UK114 family)
MRTLQPENWPRPRGYSNGIEAEGRMVFVAGQIGWDETGKFRRAISEHNSARRWRIPWPC